MQKNLQAKVASHRRGFTLIEILMVLAVITILAAIVFSVFGKVREKGRSAVCQSNLRQMYLAMQQYVQDSDGRYPQSFDPVGGYWPHKIFPYIKDIGVFRCPTISRPLPANVSPLDSWNCVYRYNSLRLESWVSGEDPHVAGHSESAADLSDYSSTIYLNVCDTPPSFQSGEVLESEIEKFSTSCGRLYRVGLNVRQHSGGANWSFLDGHIKWLTPEQLAELSCANPVLEDSSYAAP